MKPLEKSLISGDRAGLAQAITLVESTRPDHQKQAQALLNKLLPKTGKAIRIGITGAPGVGKSTFIEAFGLYAIEQGHKVAVLAVDPSSTRTGGAILGDKTRMAKLAQHADAYIRPSPTAGSLGGVARRTREAMLLTEAAGYDVIIVETVGVGQSETEVADMVDMFVLLLQPGSGDELQGIKKGIVELADLLVVTKADGDLKTQAERVRADYAAALKLLQPGPYWKPRVLACSALKGEGIDAVWKAVMDFSRTMKENGALTRQRAAQARAWMWKEIRESLLERFTGQPKMRARIQALEQDVMQGRITAPEAAQSLLEQFGLRHAS